MKLISFLISLLLLAGCASENEQKALDVIADIYSAKTSYSKNFNSATGQKTIWEFNIIASQSRLLDSFPPATVTSNIAFLLYDSFTKEEKNKYKKINVKLVSQKNDTIKNSYDTPILQEVIPKFNTFTTISEKIVQGQFSDIEPLKDPAALPDPVANFIMNIIKKWEGSYGKITDYKPIAISVTNDNVGDIYQFVGFFTFLNGKEKPYLITVDKSSGKNKMVGFSFY